MQPLNDQYKSNNTLYICEIPDIQSGLNAKRNFAIDGQVNYMFMIQSRSGI